MHPLSLPRWNDPYERNLYDSLKNPFCGKFVADQYLNNGTKIVKYWIIYDARQHSSN